MNQLNKPDISFYVPVNDRGTVGWVWTVRTGRSWRPAAGTGSCWRFGEMA